MTVLEEMAAFIVRSTLESVLPARRVDLKIRILDSLGCALHAVRYRTVRD